MFDDYNYTDQSTTTWDVSGATCTDKDDGSSKLCDLSVYAMAGKPMKACFEAKSYFRDEIFVTISSPSIDRDIEESIIPLKSSTDILGTSIKSTTDSDMYLSTASSRALEGDGNLTDGRNFFCTDWMTLPSNIYGANDWDIQMEFRINNEFYGLEEDVLWIVESDEFPVFGLFEQQPTWGLHLFSPVHYNAPEKWNKISNTKYIFNLTIPSLGSKAKSFSFGEHLPFRLLDEETPLERLVNLSITYQNGSTIPHTTEVFTQFEQIVLFIEDVNLSRKDNNFTITAETYDFFNRSVVALEGSRIALEGIENKTGTFRLSIDCPTKGRIGSDITCAIMAQIEDPQEVEKEVDFTCYILDGTSRFSSINFNKMVTRDVFTVQKSFLVPTSFEDNKQYALKCEAGYYNLGSRIDTFSDTFVADKPALSFAPLSFRMEEVKTQILIGGMIFVLIILFLIVVPKIMKRKKKNG